MDDEHRSGSHAGHGYEETSTSSHADHRHQQQQHHGQRHDYAADHRSVGRVGARARRRDLHLPDAPSSSAALPGNYPICGMALEPEIATAVRRPLLRAQGAIGGICSGLSLT